MKNWNLFTLIIHGKVTQLLYDKNISRYVYLSIRVKYGSWWIIKEYKYKTFVYMSQKAFGTNLRLKQRIIDLCSRFLRQRLQPSGSPELKTLASPRDLILEQIFLFFHTMEFVRALARLLLLEINFFFFCHWIFYEL